MNARLIELLPVPTVVVWDITYACPLRCVHCYAEAGRRPSRQLATYDMLRVADALAATGVQRVVIAGGEPLVVTALFEVAARFASHGVGLVVYTSGWHVDEAMADRLMGSDGIDHITVSLDGAAAATHDRIRGRPGSHQRTLDALDRLNARAEAGASAPALGIDWVVTRSNHQEMATLCATLLHRWPWVRSVSFGAVIPIGLASRPSFEAKELLTDAQAQWLGSARATAELQALAPATATVSTSDNRRFQMHPDWMAAHGDVPPLQIEPDGQVRAMPVYEGVVGSVLDTPLDELWRRAVARWDDPFVTDVLRLGTSMGNWAEAARRIDLRYGSAADRVRIAARPPLDH